MNEVKVLDNGTIMYLFQDEKPPIRYKIEDSGLFSCQDGSNQFGFVLRTNNEDLEFVPQFIFEEVYRTGELYKEGSDKLASQLRILAEKRRKDVNNLLT